MAIGRAEGPVTFVTWEETDDGSRNNDNNVSWCVKHLYKEKRSWGISQACTTTVYMAVMNRQAYIIFLTRGRIV